jgi:hypothetical membrane protein
VPVRLAGICGLLAFVTVNVGWIAGSLAQPSSFSTADDDISDLGATTADSPWLYNQIGANLTGLLVVALALGLWRALSSDMLGRLGACALLAAARLRLPAHPLVARLVAADPGGDSGDHRRERRLLDHR